MLAAVTVLTAGTAYAQTPGAAEPASVRRPFRGLFGGSNPDSPHELVLSASAFGAYDDNVLEALSSHRVRDPFLQQSGTYQGATAGLNYTFEKDGARMGIRGHTGGQLRYYRRETGTNSFPSLNSDITFDARLTKSLTFLARQSVAYSARYNFSLTPGLDEQDGHDIGVADDPDFDLFGMRSLRTATTLSLSQQLGRRTTVGLGYNLRTRSILEDQSDEEAADSRFRDYRTQAGSLGINHKRPLTKNAELELGYGIRISDRRSGTGEPRTMHDITAGVNYSRALSFSRRTSLSFGSGSAIAVSDRIDQESDSRTRARLIGHVTLTHEIGRTWNAQVSYSRGFRARDGFDDLYFTDGVRAAIGGLFTQRWSFGASAHSAISSLERSGQNSHRGTAATAQTNYALTSYLALFANYIYYHYRYDEGIPLDGRFPRQLDRQGVKIGLMTSIPLF
jgi:hypothetical protein